MINLYCIHPLDHDNHTISGAAVQTKNPDWTDADIKNYFLTLANIYEAVGYTVDLVEDA